jgi:peptidoglycan/xylan/chitin deacetylase (PgdA/CDA1 family)
MSQSKQNGQHKKMGHTGGYTRREAVRFIGGAGGLLWANGAAQIAEANTPPFTESNASPFAQYLNQALTAMESGLHGQALAPLRAGLLRAPNDALGGVTLGTLYLHAGSPVRAERAFGRVLRLAPDDALSAWGLCLARMARGGRPATVPSLAALSVRFPRETLPDAFLLHTYLRLLDGDTTGVSALTETVTGDEPNLLRLQIAGFAALKTAQFGRGEVLLTALLDRPEMRRLEEDRALILPFLPELPAQGMAPALPYAFDLPEPKATASVSGTITLTPPEPLPRSTTAVSYSIEGANGYAASTNVPPFLTEWNAPRYPNGTYTIRSVALDSNGATVAQQVRTVTIANTGAPATLVLTPPEEQNVTARLLRLLTPHPSRKAAHFALAERATAKGDGKAALEHMEAVVAIDPLYRNARASIARYNAAVVGACPAVWRGGEKGRLVALTFDDGPKPGSTPALLQALKEAEVPATFFVVGAQAELHPDLITQIAQHGHELANHSYSHPNLTFLDGVTVLRELCRTSAFLREVTGKRPRFYRPPGGNANAQTGQLAESLGLAGAYWTVDGLKWERPPFTPQILARRVLEGVKPGAVILLHNAPQNTIEAVPLIVAGLRTQGYECVTMTDLVRRAGRGTPPTKPLGTYTGKE